MDANLIKQVNFRIGYIIRTPNSCNYVKIGTQKQDLFIRLLYVGGRQSWLFCMFYSKKLYVGNGTLNGWGHAAFNCRVT